MRKFNLIKTRIANLNIERADVLLTHNKLKNEIPEKQRSIGLCWAKTWKMINEEELRSCHARRFSCHRQHLFPPLPPTPLPKKKMPIPLSAHLWKLQWSLIFLQMPTYYLETRINISPPETLFYSHKHCGWEIGHYVLSTFFSFSILSYWP